LSCNPSKATTTLDANHSLQNVHSTYNPEIALVVTKEGFDQQLNAEALAILYHWFSPTVTPTPYPSD